MDQYLSRDPYPNATWVAMSTVRDCKYMTYPPDTQVKFLVSVCDHNWLWDPFGTVWKQNGPDLPKNCVVFMCGPITGLKREDFSQFTFTEVLHHPSFKTPATDLVTGVSDFRNNYGQPKLGPPTSTDVCGPEHAAVVKLLWYGWNQAQHNYHIPHKYPKFTTSSMDRDSFTRVGPYSWIPAGLNETYKHDMQSRASGYLVVVCGYSKDLSGHMAIECAVLESPIYAKKSGGDAIRGRPKTTYRLLCAEEFRKDFFGGLRPRPLPSVGTVCLIFSHPWCLRYLTYYPLLGPYDLLNEDDVEMGDHQSNNDQSNNDDGDLRSDHQEEEHDDNNSSDQSMQNSPRQQQNMRQQKEPFRIEMLSDGTLSPQKHHLLSQLFHFHKKKWCDPSDIWSTAFTSDYDTKLAQLWEECRRGVVMDRDEKHDVSRNQFRQVLQQLQDEQTRSTSLAQQLHHTEVGRGLDIDAKNREIDAKNKQIAEKTKELEQKALLYQQQLQQNKLHYQKQLDNMESNLRRKEKRLDALLKELTGEK